MDIKFFDAHTHVHFPAYDNDREAVIRRAQEQNVQMICVGTQAATSASAIVLAKQYPEQIRATVGFHPSHADDDGYHDENETTENKREKFNAKMFGELAKDPKVVAIGECGLDYYRLPGERQQELKEKQKEIFLKHIELAHAVKKPLMIHCRSAFADLIELLTTHYKLLTQPSGVIHFFTGKKEDAQVLLDLGFSFTFGGAITFTEDYNDVLKFIPMENILSETDAPYVAPIPYRGKRNEPAFVIEVVKKIAEIKKLPLEMVAEQIEKNVKRIFAI